MVFSLQYNVWLLVLSHLKGMWKKQGELCLVFFMFLQVTIKIKILGMFFLCNLKANPLFADNKSLNGEIKLFCIFEYFSL